MNKDKTKKKSLQVIRDMSYEDLQEWTLEILNDIPDNDPLPPIEEKEEEIIKPKSNIGIACENIEKETPKEGKVNNYSEDFETSPNNKFVQEVKKSKEPVLKNDETSGKQKDHSIKIKDTLQDRDIMKATVESLRIAYHQYTIETGVPIQSDAIDIWPKSVLQEIIKTKRDMLISKNSPVTPKKNNSIMKQNSKYSGKKLQTNLTQSGKTMNTCRYSLAFTIPDEYKGTEGLRRYLMDVFSEMVNYGDDGFCLLPWETDTITDKISEPDDIPERITDIKKYFNGARSPESSVYIYTKLRLGFTNFDADIQGWCKNRSIRFYVCSVQHPNVRSCGWLAYMPRTVNQEKWCQAVKQLYESMNKNNIESEFQIGLTWRVLNGQKDVDKKSKLRAMHIDAPVEIGTKVKRFLRALPRKKKWILGVKYRVIDEFHQYMKPTAKQKYRYMVTKHKAMMQQIAMCDCTQIVNLDKNIGNSTMTVRDIVVNIRDIQDNYRIFASMDEKWNSDTLFTATYRPDKATNAYDFMRSLATYVKFLFPDASLKQIFTLDAIEKTKSEKYHPESQTFITQDDDELDQEIQADIDDDSIGFLEIEDELDNPFEID